MLSLLLLAACGRSGEIDFPSKLGPLESENLAAEPDGGDDPFPEILSLASGSREALYWAHGKAYIKAPAAKVAQAARNINVCLDRREVAEHSVTYDTVEEFDYSYTIHNKVNDIITVNYDITWVHELQEGTEDDVVRWAAQWDKTDGTPFIDLLAGSLIIEEAEPGVTRLEFIEHMEAAARDEEVLESYLSDYYADLRATVHGDPLPSF